MATTNTTPKFTKAQKFAMIAEIPEVKNNVMLAEFVAHEIELLAKKNASDKKPTAQQEANAAIKANIIATMEADPARIWTVTELLKAVSGLPDDMTNQRMSALVRQMHEAGIVKREEIKRKAYFSLA